MSPLDSQQRGATRAKEGPIMVNGGTGTGKTHVIVERIGALLRSGAAAGDITCLTVSEPGTDDVRSRLDSDIRCGPAAREIFVGTINQYANLFLRNGGGRTLGLAEDYSLWDRERALSVMELVWPNRSDLKLKRQEFRDALRWHWRNETRWPGDPKSSARKGYWLDVERAYAAEKNLQHALDEYDLVNLAIQVMERDPEVRTAWRSRRSRHLLVDGFEDFTPRQLQLLQLMVGPTRSLMVTRDPNQSVYGIEGADPDQIGFLRLEYRDMSSHRLQTNQQASENLSRMAVALNESESMDGLEQDGQRWDPVAMRNPRLVEIEGVLQDMDTHFLNLAQQLVGPGCAWEDMACLYRKEGIVRRMRTQLAHRDIPFKVLGAGGPERVGEARCLKNSLACVLNPWDLEAVRIAAAPGYRSKERILNAAAARTLHHLASQQGVHLIEAARSNLDSFVSGSPVFQDLSYLVQSWDDLTELLSTPRTSLHELCLRVQTLIRQAQPLNVVRAEEPAMARVWRLCEATPRLPNETPRQHLARFLDRLSPAFHAESSSAFGPGLSFGTFQAAKGLRWKTVFVLDVSDETTPGRVGRYSDTREEQRLFYAAVTRATQELYLYTLADSGRGNKVSRSRFLEPIIHLLDEHAFRDESEV